MEDAPTWRAADLRMNAQPKLLKLSEIVDLTDAEPQHNLAPNAVISAVAAIDDASAHTAVFAQDTAAFARAVASHAGVVLAARSFRSDASVREVVDARVLWVEDARLAFSLVARALRARQGATEVHPSAVIAPSVEMGEGVRIGPGVVIEEGVRLGDEVVLEARVVLHAGVRLGHRVTVHAGAVLGGAGFGWARDGHTGEYVRFPQQGHLLIEDDVSIGANCTIDRGALGDTRIGAGTKLDNLVHIGHSCSIGRRVVIAAQTGIAGSSVIGDGAVIAGQVGIADHVHIGEGVVLGAKCGVPSNKVLRGAGQVFWGIPARPIQQYLRELARLRRGLERSGS